MKIERIFVYLSLMPRSKTIPDARIYSTIRTLLDQGGEKAVSFATVAAATGLAAPTLVQRYASRDGMVKIARRSEWDRLKGLTTQAVVATEDKGPASLLKALGPPHAEMLAATARDPDLAQCAAAWRAQVEAALALRLGTGPKARETAAILFAAWAGEALWPAPGGASVKPKDLVKRLT